MRHRTRSSFAVAAAALSILSMTGRSPAAETTLTLELVTSEIRKPVAVFSPPGDPSRLLVVEQFEVEEFTTLDRGRIRLIENGVLRTEPVLTVEGLATTWTAGVLCATIDPAFPTRPYLYLFQKVTNGDLHIRRYTVDPVAMTADPATRVNLLTIVHPLSYHNGGWLGFGPDGMLYVSSGDGGPVNDGNRNGQNLAVHLAKMLRIDVTGDDFPGDPERNYAIPLDNPFVGMAGAAEEIWAWGLRQVWRASFDRVTGDFYMADVGENGAEEINVEMAGTLGGLNYGWRCREGFLINAKDPECIGATITDPVLSYPLVTGQPQCAVIGGHVYRGVARPELTGRYFFSDYCEGVVRSFVAAGGAAVDLRSHRLFDVATGEPISLAAQFASFGEDACGELYLLGHDSQIYRLVPPGGYVDCNGNGIGDRCEVASGHAADVNGNGRPDECDASCPGDINGDEGVGTADLFAVLSGFGACRAPCAKDLDGDGFVGFADVMRLLALWGPCDR